MANISRIKNVVGAIENNRDETLHFDMSDWYIFNPEYDPILISRSCGTSMCFAGWAAHVEKKEFVLSPGFFDDASFCATMFKTSDGAVSIEAWAQEYFEFTEAEAATIFGATEVETIENLKDVIEDVLEQKIWSV